MRSLFRFAPAGLAGAVLLACAGAAAAQAAAAPAGPLADLARLQRDSNAERLAELRGILDARKVPYEVQAFDSKAIGGPGEGRNVVVTLGSGPREIVVGAHYDAVKLKDGTLSRGMVDNGAGVMALVRLAEELRGRTLRHRVRLAFFDQEEICLCGSKSFVAAARPAEIAAAVNVDIAAYGDTVVFGGGRGEGSAAVFRALQRVCAERRLSCLEFPAFPTGDDRSFEAAGVPNVSVASLPAAEAHQLWLLLNGGAESGLEKGFAPKILKAIHTHEDTLDQVDPATLERFPGVLLDLVLELDAALDGGAKEKRE
ncbi:MAG: M28 family metallopeptidase [Thermoanaerobaculia bacterium]